MATTYEGWNSYETWAVNLWLQNEEWSHDVCRDLARNHAGDVDGLAAALREFVEVDEAFGVQPAQMGATLASDLLTAALGECDWHEIAEHLAACLAEDNAYRARVSQ